MKSKGQPKKSRLDRVLGPTSARRDGISARAISAETLANGKPGCYELAEWGNKPTTSRVCTSSVAE